MSDSIILRPVAITDLGIKYARSMGGNKIRQYVVPYQLILANQFSEKSTSAEGLISEFIKNTEKIENVQFLNPPQTALGTSTNSLHVEDITDQLLTGPNKDIKKALLKNTVKKAIFEREIILNDQNKLKQKLFSFINENIIAKINRLLIKIQAPHATIEEIMFLNLKTIPYFPLLTTRTIESVRFLSVAFEEGQLKEALNSLISDLRILQDNKLIIGNLMMPSLIALSDTIGTGKLTYAVYCGIFVDSFKISTLLNLKNPFELPYPLYLKSIGVKNETLEGSINYLNGISIESKYDIEQISIDTSEEENHKARIDSYLASVDTVNAVAKKYKKLIVE